MSKLFLKISYLLMICIFLFSGCTIPSTSEITPPAKIDYLADPDFFLYRIDWLDQDRCNLHDSDNRKTKDIGVDIGRIIVWDKNTNRTAINL